MLVLHEIIILRMKQLQATTNAVINPVANNGISFALNMSQLLIKSKPLAATIIGTAKMNVYSAAAVCDTR